MVRIPDRRKHITLAATFLFWMMFLLISVSPRTLAWVKAPTKREGLSAALAPGLYPGSEDEPLLAGDYEQPPNPGLSPYNMSQNANNYPIFPATSCGTNNLRYWKRPGNGTCAPAGMCGSLYKATPQRIPPPPTAPAWDAGVRVNFFESCLS